MGTIKPRSTVGAQLCKDLIGKSIPEAKDMCQSHDFRIRFRSINGQPCIITADIREDRIECHVINDAISQAMIG